MAALQPLLDHFQVTEAQLMLLPRSVIDAAIATLALQPPQVAKLYVELAKNANPDSTGEALLRHFSEEEKRARERWRATAERLAVQREQFATEPTEDQRALFVDLAKSSMLSAAEVLTGTYLMFGDNAALRFYSGILLRCSESERILSHNMYVASKLGDTFLSTHGDAIVSLAWPLFPPDARFSALNQRLLFEAGGATGAGAYNPSVFRKSSVQGGGYFAPVVQTPEHPGGVVDLSEIERAFVALQNAMSNTNHRRNDNGRGRSEGRGEGRGAGRGEGRGRGRGRYRGGRQPLGGATEYEEHAAGAEEQRPQPQESASNTSVLTFARNEASPGRGGRGRGRGF